MLNKKQTIIIIVMLAIAFITLILAAAFLIPAKPSQNEDQVNANTTETLLKEYQVPIHTLLSIGSFPVDNETFVSKLNMLLDENQRCEYNSGKIISKVQDQWNRNIYLILEDKYIQVVSYGQDGTYNTNDDIKILIFIAHTSDGYSITTTSQLFESCYHFNYTSNILQEGDCINAKIVQRVCQGCGHTVTDVALAPGHDFPEAEGCGDVQCRKCVEILSKDELHQYVVMKPSDETLATQGSCNTRSTYFYVCAICGKNGQETYEYDYVPSIHNSDGRESFLSSNGINYFNLNCEHCNEVFLTVNSVPYSGLYDGQEHSIQVNTTGTITYSTDRENYSKDKPVFKDIGQYTVYYRVVAGQYTINGFDTVSTNDNPQIYVFEYDDENPNQLNREIGENTWLDPYVHYQPTLTIQGIVHDTNQIAQILVNGEPVTWNEDNIWTYELDLSKKQIIPLHVYAKDIYGAESTIIRFFAYDLNDALNADLNGNVYLKEIWHVSDPHVLINGICGNPAAVKEIRVDGELITMNQQGYWEKYVDVPVETTSIIPVEIVEWDGLVVTNNIKICHTAVHGTWAIDVKNIAESVVELQLFNPINESCNKIQQIVVSGTIDNPVILEGHASSLKTDQGYICYYNTGKDKPSKLTVSCPIDFTVPRVIIDVYMTHGQHMRYELEMGWYQTEFIGLFAIVRNMETGEYTVSAFEPLPPETE